MSQIQRCDRCAREIPKASYRVQISHLPIMRTPGGLIGGDVCRRCGEAMLAVWFASPTAEPTSSETVTVDEVNPAL